MKTLYYFKYRIQYWEEVFEKEMNFEGIVAGCDTIEAVKRIVKYYGDENINKLEIDCMEDRTEVYELEELL